MKTEEPGKPNAANDNVEPSKIEKAKIERAKLENEREIRSVGVRKGAVTASILGLVILIVAGIIMFTLYNRGKNQLFQQMDTQKITFADQVNERDSLISEWIVTFDKIEKNIAMIKEKEKLITDNSASVEISKDRKLKVLDDISLINNLLEQNKKKIASLTAQLKQSGGSMKVLQSKIAELEANMKQNEFDIAELKSSLLAKNFEAEQLNTQITYLQDTIAQKDMEISTRNYIMNKAFYVSGTFKELKDKGLLTKEGGFIGIGRTESLTGDFSDDSFVQVDLSQTVSIPVNARSAKLISEHPRGSYEFMLDDNKNIMSVAINDPAEFWKISKYAVVEKTK